MEWIDAKTRPEEGQHVLFAYRLNGKMMCCDEKFYECCCIMNGEWTFGYEKVLYWFPIPELPEEVDNGMD